MYIGILDTRTRACLSEIIEVNIKLMRHFSSEDDGQDDFDGTINEEGNVGERNSNYESVSDGTQDDFGAADGLGQNDDIPLTFMSVNVEICPPPPEFQCMEVCPPPPEFQ